MLIKSKKFINIITIIFLILELILYFVVQITDNDLNTITKYLVVTFTFLYSLIYIKKEDKFYLIVVGLFFTLIADFFLVIIDPLYRELGLISFSITQIFYYLFIDHNLDKKLLKKLNLLLRITTTIVLLIIVKLMLKDDADFITLISVFYFLNLLINIIFSFLIKNKSLVLSVGLILFALCDICVGFAATGTELFQLKEGTFLYFLANPTLELSYLFYIPSQVMIAISGYELKKK